MKKTNLIHINPYPKPKKDGGGGSSNITFNINTSDIGGDLNVKSLNANRVMAEYVEANNLEATNGKFVYLVASDGTISTLRGNNLTYDTANIGDLTANNIETQKLNVTDTATIENIFNTYLNSKEIVTDYLTVNKSAHFFEVIIDKIKSVGGTIINTATSCVLDYVIPYNASGPTTFDDEAITKYRCYWKRYANENSQDRKDEVKNDWWVKDQAISQNCNLVSGVNHNAGNHYYWRLVDDVSGENPVYINFDTGQVWEEEGIPEYQIKFSGHEKETEEDVDINAGFTYDNGETNTEDRPNAQLIITDWNIAPVSGIVEDWDETKKIFTVRDTINGLQITPIPNGSDDIEQAPYISKGTLSFATEYPTRLNLFVFYDDETVEYHPAPDVKQSIYQINLASITGAIATRFVITSAEVNIWHLCNWIDLSNTDKDAPTHITGNFDDAPRPGDNVCQLGYRYTEYQEGDEEYVPSRASAIIIASFATPDSGGTVNGKVIKPIVPPSYAQYQNITDYNLYTHRGTYMDAEEAHFKGAIEAGSSIDGDVVNVTTKMWKLVPDKDPIVKGDTVQFTIFYSENGEGRAITSLDTGWYLMVYTNGSGSGNRFNTLSVTTTSATQSLKVELWDGSGTGNILRDVFQATTIDLSDITDGVDGAYNQWIYRNWASGVTGPSAPTSTSTYPPTDWYATPQPITASLPYTWMSTRTVTPRSSSQINYGTWSKPIRITGDDGKPGTDGKYTEFIYRRFKEPPTWTTNNLNPNNWSVNSNPDYLGIAYQTNNSDSPNNKWTDNPRGVNDTYKYEYVSSRSYDGTTFTKFDVDTQQPSLWSKYGENGMDGDGVEYIFTSYHGATLPTTGYPGYDDNTITIDGQQKTITFTEDDFYPAGWNDDPISPTESNPYIFVSQRKQVNGEWIKPTSTITGTPWSEPTIWARWSKDGKDGTNGQKGADGNDGDTDILAPVSERFIVTISLNNYNNATEVWTSDYYNQVKSVLKCDLQYKINKKVGNDYAVMTASDISAAGYTLKFRLNMTSGATYTDNFTLDDNTFKFPTTASYKSNLLNWLYTKQSSNKTSKNYEKDAMEGKDTPVSCDVLLYKNGVEVMVAKHYDVIFDTGDIFRHDKYAFNSILFGTYTYVDDQGNTVTINSMSSIHQTMKEISTRVQGITYNSTTGETTIDGSTIQQLSDSITASVSQSVLNTVDSRGYQTSSQVQLTAESISAAVQTDIEGKLKRTGIDISNGLVNIASDNTTIGGNVYIHGDVLKSNGLISSVYLPVSCTCSRKENTSDTYTLTTNKSLIDTLVAGDKITIDNLNKELLQTDLRGQTSSQPSLLGTVTYKIYRDSTLFKSFTSKPSSAITISTGGTYYLEVTATANLTGAYSYTFNAGLDITLSKATAVEIADNGINLSLADSSSNKHYMRFSPDTIESAIFEVGTYATNNGSQHFPLGGLRIANGIPQMRITQETYGNTSHLPTYSRVESAGLWGSLGSQLAVKMCSTNSEHPHPQVDFYIYADTQPSNAVFDLTVTGNEAMYGLYTGRIIRIKGYDGLVIKCPTKIIRKDQYYGNDSKSQQIKMGKTTTVNNNFNSNIGTVIGDQYSITLILVGTIWYEI